MRRVAIIFITVLLLASGCAGETTKAPQTAESTQTAETTQAPRAEPTFPFEEDVRGPITYVEYKPGTLMAIVPTQTADPAPCVVILHGHQADTTAVQELAQAVAKKGAVVFLPDWDDTLPSHEDSRTQTITKGLDDVADAMRFVRLYAGRYGGDPERIVIVGHSLGAVAAMTTMLAGDRFGTDAFPREVSALPDAYVSLDGIVPFRELLWREDLRRFYEQDPATWDKINPDTYLDDAAVRKGAEFRFFVATLDIDQTKSMAKRMKKLGYTTSVERINVDHAQAAEPQKETVKAIIELAHPD